MSIMALDVGSRRIGVAIADPGNTFALPIGTIERSTLHADLEQLAQYFASYAVTDVVIGDPVTLCGERGIAAQKMDTFIEHLARMYSGRIHRVDERMTTAQATKTLIAADVSRKKRKDVVDKMAAALILETFLLRRRNEDR
ncbi:MAG: Holliday junction resolvase RuvX [Vulcanimicrobiaceae bacterium]